MERDCFYNTRQNPLSLGHGDCVSITDPENSSDLLLDLKAGFPGFPAFPLSELFSLMGTADGKPAAELVAGVAD